MPNRIAPLSLILCCAMLTACGEADAPTNPNAAIKVKIGFAAPLTGSQAHLGKDLENAARLAVEEINASHPKIGNQPAEFELLAEDDMADPRTATTVAQKFADKGVNGVIGHLNSGASIPASKIYHDNGIVQISPASTAIAYTAQGYRNAFRVMANDSQQGKALGVFAAQTLGAKNIAIIDDRTAYGQGLADEFEKAAKSAGATIVAHEFTNDKASDFNAILTNIKGHKPDLLFYGGMDGQGAPMVKQMRELGMLIPMMGGDGMRSDEFLKLAGADAQGVIGSLPGVPFEQMPNGEAFKQKFEAKYGPIQLYAPYGYDAVQIMAAAMQKAGSADPTKYAAAVATTQHSGVSANIAFDNKGDLQSGAVTLYRAMDGQWEVVETMGAAQ